MEFGVLIVISSLVSLALVLVYKLIRYALQTMRLYMLYRMRIKCAITQCSDPTELEGNDG